MCPCFPVNFLFHKKQTVSFPFGNKICISQMDIRVCVIKAGLGKGGYREDVTGHEVMPIRLMKVFFKKLVGCIIDLLTIEIMSTSNRIQFSLVTYFMFHLLLFTCLKVIDMVKNIKWKLKLFFCRSLKLMKMLPVLLLEALID